MIDVGCPQTSVVCLEYFELGRIEWPCRSGMPKTAFQLAACMEQAGFYRTKNLPILSRALSFMRATWATKLTRPITAIV